MHSVMAGLLVAAWTVNGLQPIDAPSPPTMPERGAAGQAAGQGTGGAQPAGPKVVEEGIIPKSIKIPGTDVSLGIGGYVKVDVIQDFGPIQDAYEFKVNSIPATGSAAAAQSGRTTIHARETRLNLDLRSHGGPQPLRAFVEGDFFGDNNAFRLRHGFGEYGRLLGGQTWTTFMDISARPLSLDYEGPDGELFVRQAMVRWSQPLAKHWTWAVAVESPSPQFAVPSSLSGSARSSMPDIPTHIRYERPRGHVQAGALVRQLRFDGGEGVDDLAEFGWGVSFTFSVKTVGRDQLQGQFIGGEGVARYIEGLGGQNLDAVLAPAGVLTALRSRSWMVAYTRAWSSRLKSGVAYSGADVGDDPGLSSTAIERLRDFRVSLIYSPYQLVDVGGEVMWGRRDNKDKTHGDSWRFQFAVIYRLN